MNRYVLSPVIGSIDGADDELNWRRPLWEFFYPRIRRENHTENAARIIVRNLRERVTIVDGDFPPGIETMWRTQLASPEGFERIYVAAMRSAGVPARLDEAGLAEFWTGAEWKPAPRPLVEESWAGILRGLSRHCSSAKAMEHRKAAPTGSVRDSRGKPAPTGN